MVKTGVHYTFKSSGQDGVLYVYGSVENVFKKGKTEESFET